MQPYVEFRWNEWNIEHATKHGCTVEEIESVVKNAGRGWPRLGENGKYTVESRGRGARMIRVIYVIDPEGTLYVIHAMPLTTRRRRGR
jgi:hypothetical protein